MSSEPVPDVVLHLPPHTPGNLATVLGRDSAMPVTTARDGDPIVPAEIRVAATDRHLVVDPHVMRLTDGRARRSRGAFGGCAVR